MGPTNVALLKLYEAETHLREAQRKLDSATRNVRLQQRKVDDLTSRQQTTADSLIKQRAKGSELDLEIKSKDEKIEHLRNQQASAQTNREYQAFLIEINTHKVDKAKIEEEALKIMEAVEALQKETESLATQLTAESAKLVELRGSIDDRVKQLTADVEAARPLRDEAAQAVSPTARLLFERLAERYDGEAMEPIDKPHPKREEYVAMICNVDLTVDIYNRLHTRDEVIGCPSCGRLMFIPADLVPEKAVHKPKEKKARKPKGDLAAPIPLQSLAGSVVSSVDQDEDEEVVSVQVTEEGAPTTDSQ
jgi:predicted  nucleic acid-binding Zn-ribbon protein